MNSEKLVAITFDDGPNTTIMPMVLDILKTYGAKATFFLIADKISDMTAPVMLRAVEEGHELANHSYSHLHMAELDEAQIRSEIFRAQELTEEYAHVTPTLFRPPFINVSDLMRSVIPMPFIVGADTRDWDTATTAKQRIDRALDAMEDGVILLMHCFEKNEATLEALHTILPAYIAEGYRFVTVSDLFAKKGVQPEAGKTYNTVK